MSNGATGWRWGWAEAGDSAQRRHDAFAHEGIRTTIAGRTHQKLERVAEEIGCWRAFSGCLPGRMNSVARADIARLLGINRRRVDKWGRLEALPERFQCDPTPTSPLRFLVMPLTPS
jgi:hypothetical protein